MVPSDTWKPGVQDIRDKELAKVYNAFLDKGVKLTVIMDCCHSGSLSRGPNTPGSSGLSLMQIMMQKMPPNPHPRKQGRKVIS
ncbi:MAG: hypothetical protein IPK57_12810 [Chitinophagaceae bacterium]|nr:hypothetical protein [Chitinophagaceae bacterium]